MINEVKKSLSAKNAVIIKAFVVLAVILVLCVPLSMIQSVLRDREHYHNETISNITSTWGGAQTIVGPVLVVPYLIKQENPVTSADGGGAAATLAPKRVNAYFLPNDLLIESAIKSEKRYRGIYEAVIFSGDFTIRGTFASPNIAKVFDENILWDEAFVSFAVSDLRGVKDTLKLQLDKDSFALEPGVMLSDFPTGVHAPVGSRVKTKDSIPFSLQVSLNGSEAVNFVPLGQQNTVTLTSNWPDPSFEGKFLPTERTVTGEGFSAKWQMSHYATNFPRFWNDNEKSFCLTTRNTQSSSFSVRFIDPVDFYRAIERSMKYDILVLVLTFTVFFLYEVISGSPVHPFQYGLVGAALALFYLALLSLSEVIAFGASYLGAAILCTGMITMYVRGFMKSWKGTAAVVLNLATTYFFIYFILQLQDYALLVGTGGLFLALGGVMYFTRGIDWYGEKSE
jgi:inner membrane protein